MKPTTRDKIALGQPRKL